MVPEAAVVTLWQHKDGLKERHARKLLAGLDRKTLLKLQGQEPHRLVTLHDLQHDYLREVAGENLVELHERLLTAYQNKCSDGWPTGPNDDYFFQHLAYHLFIAGRREELGRPLLNYDWLRAKLAATDVQDVVHDYLFLREDAVLRTIQDALRLSAHVMSRDVGELPSQLTGRLMGHRLPAIQGFLEEIRGKQKDPWLLPLAPSLRPPAAPYAAPSPATMPMLLRWR
jgi:hypothetical protein